MGRLVLSKTTAQRPTNANPRITTTLAYTIFIQENKTHRLKDLRVRTDGLLLQRHRGKNSHAMNGGECGRSLRIASMPHFPHACSSPIMDSQYICIAFYFYPSILSRACVLSLSLSLFLSFIFSLPLSPSFSLSLSGTLWNSMMASFF